jgi:hypothetical protein
VAGREKVSAHVAADDLRLVEVPRARHDLDDALRDINLDVRNSDSDSRQVDSDLRDPNIDLWDRDGEGAALQKDRLRILLAGTRRQESDRAV